MTEIEKICYSLCYDLRFIKIFVNLEHHGVKVIFANGLFHKGVQALQLIIRVVFDVIN